MTDQPAPTPRWAGLELAGMIARFLFACVDEVDVVDRAATPAPWAGEVGRVREGRDAACADRYTGTPGPVYRQVSDAELLRETHLAIFRSSADARAAAIGRSLLPRLATSTRALLAAVMSWDHAQDTVAVHDGHGDVVRELTAGGCNAAPCTCGMAERRLAVLRAAAIPFTGWPGWKEIFGPDPAGG